MFSPEAPEELATEGLPIRLWARLWAKTEAGPGDCWLWTGATNQGYGVLGTKKGGPYKQFRTHRLAYEFMVGPIPDGLTLDHLCRVRNCVNPDHLEPVTSTENSKRIVWGGSQMKANWSHCMNGHEFTPENTLSYDGRRRCRECWNASQRRRRAERRAASDV